MGIEYTTVTIVYSLDSNLLKKIYTEDLPIYYQGNDTDDIYQELKHSLDLNYGAEERTQLFDYKIMVMTITGHRSEHPFFDHVVKNYPDLNVTYKYMAWENDTYDIMRYINGKMLDEDPMGRINPLSSKNPRYCAKQYFLSESVWRMFTDEIMDKVYSYVYKEKKDILEDILEDVDYYHDIWEEGLCNELEKLFDCGQKAHAIMANYQGYCQIDMRETIVNIYKSYKKRKNGEIPKPQELPFTKIS